MTLELDDTTALIGENSCGKTSVLDALELALAHRATVPFFGPLDFHVPNAPGAAPVERISLRFTFLESDRHEVVAEIVATRTTDGSPARAIPRLVDREGRELHPGDPAAFEAFRRRHPVLRVRFGRPARPAPAEAPGPAGSAFGRPGLRRSRAGRHGLGGGRRGDEEDSAAPSRAPTGSSRVRGVRIRTSCASRSRRRGRWQNAGASVSSGRTAPRDAPRRSSRRRPSPSARPTRSAPRRARERERRASRS